MTKNEMALLISMMAYAQGACDAKELKAVSDLLQDGINMLIEKLQKGGDE